jgi:hypothetical protein
MSDSWPADGIQQQAWRSARRLASKDRQSIPGLFPRMAHGQGGPRRRLKTCRGRTCRAIRSATSRAQPVCEAYSTCTQGPSIRPSMRGHSNQSAKTSPDSLGQVEGKCSNQAECTAVPAAKTGTRPANLLPRPPALPIAPRVGEPLPTRTGRFRCSVPWRSPRSPRNRAPAGWQLAMPPCFR